MLKKFSEFRKYWEAERAVQELEAKVEGFETLFTLVSAENKQNDDKYHSTHHMLYVASIAKWLLEQELYGSKHKNMLSEAALYIACMLHDYKHSVGMNDDDHNIEIACINLPTITSRVWQMPVAVLNLSEKLIQTTRYPFLEERYPSSILERVIRDADLLYALTVDPVERYYILSKLQQEMECKLPVEQRSNMSVEELSALQLKFYSTVEMFTDTGIAIMEEFLNVNNVQ